MYNIFVNWDLLLLAQTSAEYKFNSFNSEFIHNHCCSSLQLSYVRLLDPISKLMLVLVLFEYEIDKQALSVIPGYDHYNLDYSLFYCLLLVPGVVLDVSVFMRRAYMSGVVTPLLVIRWKPPDFTGGTITNYTVSIDWDVS